MRETSPLPDDTPVWVNTQGREDVPERVSRQAEAPRSYRVDTPTGEVRRTRSHLRVRAESPNPNAEPDQEPANDSTSDPSPAEPTNGIATRSRTGTTTRPPDRYSTWVSH